MPVVWLNDSEIAFPHPDQATKEGILAIGGDLSEARLLFAYQKGIFPWYTADEPILWWSPDPRFVLFPDELKVSRSMRPYFNQRRFEVSYDSDFEAVIRACQEPRPESGWAGTWITEEMVEAYTALHKEGYVHSVEVWKDDELVGGLYGLSLGKVFFGESMFTRVSNASKFGFISLVRKLREKGFWLIDCQQQTRHLGSLGARSIPRSEFLKILRKNECEPTLKGNWGELL
ncbi:MAG: leucyl/phenylalanyl-tRNA--protein transferase [Saprospiraceae bacterium]